MAAAFVFIIHLWEVCYNRQQQQIQRTEINEQIRDKEIRLIGADGAQMGIMSPRDALKMAIDKDL